MRVRTENNRAVSAKILASTHGLAGHGLLRCGGMLLPPPYGTDGPCNRRRGGEDRRQPPHRAEPAGGRARRRPVARPKAGRNHRVERKHAPDRTRTGDQSSKRPHGYRTRTPVTAAYVRALAPWDLSRQRERLTPSAKTSPSCDGAVRNSLRYAALPSTRRKRRNFPLCFQGHNVRTVPESERTINIKCDECR